MDENNISRRTALRAALATGVTALAGCGSFGRDRTGTGNHTGTPGESSAKRVVDVAAQGADTEGNEPVNPILNDNVGDDTHLHFPPGRYRLERWEIADYRNLAITGEDAVLVPPDGMQTYWLAWGDLENFRFEGFTLDCREEDAAPVNRLRVDGGRNVVRDVAVKGHRTANESKSGFELSVDSPDAELLVKNVRLPDGAIHGSGIYLFPDSVGELVIENCHIEHWGEGLYASPHSGPLTVVGGYFANNGIAQIRTGGGRNDTQIRDAVVRVDNPQDSQFKPNMRGIWLKEGTSTRIENCDIAITDLTGTYSSGGIVVGRQYGTAEIVDTHVRVDADGTTPAIIIRRPVDSMEGQSMPSMDRLPDNWDVACRGIRIEGETESGTAVRTVDRDNCEYSDVCIHQPLGSRDGFKFDDLDGCTVSDSTINVGGEPIVAENSTYTTKRVQKGGSCQ